VEPARPSDASPKTIVAAQPEASNNNHNDDTIPRRTHGGALPS
jgi:hypothetical protein